MSESTYDKRPVVAVRGINAPAAWAGWDAIAAELREAIELRRRGRGRGRGHGRGHGYNDAGAVAGAGADGGSVARVVMVVECYPGVLDDELLPVLRDRLRPAKLIEARDAMLPPEQIGRLVERDVTADPVFGHLTQLTLDQFFDPQRLRQARREIDACENGLVLVYGTGASLLATADAGANADADVLVYADLARWEAQNRFRRDQVSNLGAQNRGLKWSLQYKRAFFVDWRVADRLKKRLIERWDYLLDTTAPGQPKLATGEAVREGLRQTAKRPFRVVPFFDPAPWGGQWMKRVCGLDPTAGNFGWCFDCVPEENSLLLEISGTVIELPAIDLVFYRPRKLLGEAVHARFGTEFPIRFDFLDTIGGGNLSLQVHPLTEYIQQHFGMHYTQDESYYLLDTAGADACVYLGLRNGVDRQQMIRDLRRAQADADAGFDAERYVNRWPAKKHDHFLIPAGTIHCSGRNALVLEISATPYIFTFKLWDWGRLGLDGQPRPIHLEHGIANLQWDRDAAWTARELINRVVPVGGGDGWREQRTGLHDREFIETRRHWFTGPVPHHTGGGVNVLNLVEGEEAIVESPAGAFEPFVVHYAETFIVPAAVGGYTIRPGPGASRGKELATIKAYVRT